MNIRRTQGGFTLLELAVGLAVSAVAGLLLWQLLPVSRRVAGVDATQQQLRRVQDTLEGYVLSQSRLPCPAPDANGVENCAAGAGAAASSGFLPWSTLGLGRADGGLKYAVYRVSGSDLAASGLLSYAGHLPPVTGYTARATANGLDFCQGLRQAVASPTATLGGGVGAGGVPVAYLLASPGANGQFDGLNATAQSGAGPVAFELPGRAPSPSYDDQVAAAGLAELSERLGCPERLGSVSAKARSAYAAYDLSRNAGMFQTYRGFVYRVRQTNTLFAAFNVALSAAEVAITVANGVTSLSLAANSAGIGGATIAGAAIPAAAAVVAQGVADASLVAAGLAETKALNQYNSAQALYLQSQTDLASAMQDFQQSDAKGLLP